MAPRIPLGLIVHVHPRFKLDAAPEREARVDIPSFPVYVRIQPRPGAIYAKV